jgi:hypothetical protein
MNMADRVNGSGAADCPECEICCAIGLCCPPAAQRAALIKIFARETGEAESECAKYADALVEATRKAREHGAHG